MVPSKEYMSISYGIPIRNGIRMVLRSYFPGRSGLLWAVAEVLHGPYEAVEARGLSFQAPHGGAARCAAARSSLHLRRGAARHPTRAIFRWFSFIFIHFPFIFHVFSRIFMTFSMVFTSFSMVFDAFRRCSRPPRPICAPCLDFEGFVLSCGGWLATERAAESGLQPAEGR